MSRFLTLPALAVLLFPGVLPFGEGSRSVAAEPSFAGKDLSYWLKELKDGKTVRQRRRGLEAAKLIGPAKSRRIVPAVVNTLDKDESPVIRKAAALGLGQMTAKARADEIDGFRYEQVRIALVKALKADKSGEVRAAAAAAIRKLGDEARETVGTLARALKDTDEETRTEAAKTLHYLGKGARDAMPDLTQALKNKEAGELTRETVVLAIARIGSPDAADAVPALREVLRDVRAPSELRKTVAEALGLIGKDAAPAAPDLAKVLTDANAKEPLRRAVATALNRLGVDAQPALAALLKAIKDEDRYVRCLVMHSLGQMGTVLGDKREATVNALLSGVDDSILEARLAAIQALGALGAEGLGKYKQKALARLKDARRDTRQVVQDAVQHSIDQITGKLKKKDEKEKEPDKRDEK